MINLFKANRTFLLSYFLLLIGSFVIILLVPKGDEVIWLNKFYNQDRNDFFIWATRLGEEWISIVTGLTLLFTLKLRTSMGYIVNTLMVALLVYVFKNFIFEDAVRPRIFLSEHSLNFVKGLFINSSHSFPSGHTAAAFAVFSYLAFVNNNRFGLFFLALAVLAGLSRIYLAQHFLIDVVAGSILGLCFSSFCYWFFHDSKWLKSPIWDKKLLK